MFAQKYTKPNRANFNIWLNHIAERLGYYNNSPKEFY